ncbi:MAG: hypothetical protein ACKOZM_09460, partial [Flavobacteriales bacterium]
MKRVFVLFYCIILASLLATSTAAQTPVAVRVNGLQAPTVTMIVEYFAEDNWKNLHVIKDPQSGTYAGKVNFPHDVQYRFR